MEYIARVFVTPKPAILDPQGKAISASLHSLGYEEVEDVRLGKLLLIRLHGEGTEAIEARVEDMCRRLLANEVIEDYHFEVEARPA